MLNVMLVLIFIGQISIFIIAFGIWRAMLAKTEISLKASITYNLLIKSLDKLSSRIDSNISTNNELKKEFRELNRTINNHEE